MRTLLLLQCAAGALAFYSGWHGAPLVGGGRDAARSVRGRRATSMMCMDSGPRSTEKQAGADMLGNAVKPNNAESKVVPFGHGAVESKKGAPLQRRTAVGAGAILFATAVLLAPSSDSSEPAAPSTAVERMRARRKAEAPAEPTMAEDSEDTLSGTGESDGAGQLMERVISGTKSTVEAAKKVGSAAAIVGATTVKVGQAVVSGVDAALDVTLPVAQSVAQKAGPIIRDGIENAGPIVKDAADKAAPLMKDAVERAAPFVQQALDKADPLFDGTAEAITPALRGTTEAFQKATETVSNNAQLGQVQEKIQDASKAIDPIVRETAKQIKPAIPIAGKAIASVAGGVAGAARWSAEVVGVASEQGLDGVRDEVLSTLKDGAQATAQVTRDVVLPKAVEVTQDVVIPAAKTVGREVAKGLGDAAQRAMDTPNGQALSQKVTSAMTDLSSQKDAIAQNVQLQAVQLGDQAAQAAQENLSKVQAQTGQVIDQATRELGKVKIPQIDAPKP